MTEIPHKNLLAKTKLELKSLKQTEDTTIELGDLTILCGRNCKGIYEITDYVFSDSYLLYSIPFWFTPIFNNIPLTKRLESSYFGSEDFLFFSEPESYMHPIEQRKLAKIFSDFIQKGVKLFVTTTSDYLIKELNNLIILSNEFESKERLKTLYGYTKDFSLGKDKVKAYELNGRKLQPCKITDVGIEVVSFDKEIIKMNSFYNEATSEIDASYEL